MTESKVMTRSEMIVALVDRQPQLQPRDVDLAVRVLLSEISSTLARGGRVEIRGFGSFSLRHRPGKIGRNPKSGVPVKLPAKHVPHFKPGQLLRQRVNRPKDRR